MMLNHKLGGEGETYDQHEYEAELKDAWARWSAHIDSIVSDQIY